MAAPAHAPTELPVDLRWQAPASCPDRDTVLHAARQHAIGFEEPPRRIHATATVRATEGGYELHLAIDGEDGESEHDLASNDCDVLANAAAFMVAVAMDPVAKAEDEARQLEEATASPPVEAPPAAKSPPVEAPPAAKSPPEATEPRVAGFVAATGGVQIAQLGPVAPVASLEGGVRLRRARAGILASYLAPIRRGLADTGGRGDILLQQWAIGGTACALPQLPRVEFPVCVAAAGGMIHGRAEGIEAPAADTQAAFFATVGSGVTWSPRGWIGLGLRAETWINFARGRFDVGGLGTVFEVPWVSGTAQAVLELRFPSRAQSRRRD